MAGCLTVEQFRALPDAERVQRAMAGIRKTETGSFEGNYTIRNKAGAGGAYQYVDSTWNSKLKEFGLTGPGQANNASKVLQDQVAFLDMSKALKRLNNDPFKLALYWFFPITLSKPELLDKVPVVNGKVTQNPTPRHYATIAANHILCGKNGGTVYTDIVAAHEWKFLPICVTTPRTTNADVDYLYDIFGLTEAPKLYGTALQYLIVRFQNDNGLPTTGCVDKATADKLSAVIGEDMDAGTGFAYTAISDPDLVKSILSNKRISFSDASKRSDIANGYQGGNGTRAYVNPRVLRFMLGLAQNHTFTVSSVASSHPLYINGTKSVSQHKVGRAIDISVVDGRSLVSSPVSFWNSIVEDIFTMPASYRPSRIGMTDASSLDDRNGVIVFKNPGHRNHIHCGFDL